MQAYQQRVVDEKAQLDEKIAKLQTFVDSTKFAFVDMDEQARLSRQLVAMKEYSAILGERIAVWPQDAGE